jgi:hypothetical protein
MVPVIASESPARAPKAVAARGNFEARSTKSREGRKSRKGRERGINDGEPRVRSSGMEAIFRYGI